MRVWGGRICLHAFIYACTYVCLCSVWSLQERARKRLEQEEREAQREKEQQEEERKKNKRLRSGQHGTGTDQAGEGAEGGLGGDPKSPHQGGGAMARPAARRTRKSSRGTDASMPTPVPSPARSASCQAKRLTRSNSQASSGRSRRRR